MNEMNIETPQYMVDPFTNEKESITAVIDSVTVSVPLDPANTDYQAIQEWVAEGNTIAKAD